MKIGTLLKAASNGDFAAIAEIAHSGTNLFTLDYDDRSPLHLAAANGHVEIVKFIIDWCPKNKKER